MADLWTVSFPTLPAWCPPWRFVQPVAGRPLAAVLRFSEAVDRAQSALSRTPASAAWVVFSALLLVGILARAMTMGKDEQRMPVWLAFLSERKSPQKLQNFAWVCRIAGSAGGSAQGSLEMRELGHRMRVGLVLMDGWKRVEKRAGDGGLGLLPSMVTRGGGFQRC